MTTEKLIPEVRPSGKDGSPRYALQAEDHKIRN
jgi:hypothetical protein